MDAVITRGKKIFIGTIGGLVVLIGLILVPYPGPGWLVVFGGLAILSTEFTFAKRVLKFARGKYNAWTNWLKRQSWPIRVLAVLATGLVVLTTLWLLNMFSIVGGFLGVDYRWIISPFFR